MTGTQPEHCPLERRPVLAFGNATCEQGGRETDEQQKFHEEAPLWQRTAFATTADPQAPTRGRVTRGLVGGNHPRGINCCGRGILAGVTCVMSNPDMWFK